MNISEKLEKIVNMYPVVVSDIGSSVFIEPCDDFDLLYGHTGLTMEGVVEQVFNELKDFKGIKKSLYRVVINK